MTNHEDIKNITDYISLGVVAGTLMDWLPALAALLSIVWTGIRIYEWWKTKKNN